MEAFEVANNPSPIRLWTSRAFENACRLSGMDNKELCVKLAGLTQRSTDVAGQTLFDWRKGVNPVPFEIFAAACVLARVDPRTVIGLDPDVAGIDIRQGFGET